MKKQPTTLQIEIEKSRATGIWNPRYTAGDWHAWRAFGGKTYVVTNPPENENERFTGQLIASETTCPDWKENAPLIAAAPALHFALAMLQACPNDPRAHRVALDALALISAAAKEAPAPAPDDLANRIALFGADTLSILETRKEWNADTLDDINQAAADRELTGEDGGTFSLSDEVRALPYFTRRRFAGCVDGLRGTEILMTEEQARGASHQGECDADAAALALVPEIAAQLDKIGAETIRAALKESGAYDAAELCDYEKNRVRVVWFAACDIRETLDESRE